MYNMYQTYPHPYYFNLPMPNIYGMYPYAYYVSMPMNPYSKNQPNNMYSPFIDELEYDSNFKFSKSLKDYGPEPFVINIDKATKENNNFRTALWTGENLQVTLMSIDINDDIGLEVHPNGDQFIRIEQGTALVQMGDKKNKLDYEKKVYDDYAIMIPAGKWHNIINIGNTPLKLYAIYAPPEHPYGTVHETKEIAEAAEKNYSR
ncbi:cupin domain-containing protein [Clostridium botulinum]|nr:cupin domain-containing protein [Clostridium botulinum]